MSRAHRHRRGAPPRAGGFTLLELLIAISLMAVLAVLSWRGLDSVLETRTRLQAASDETRALSVLFGQMEEDLQRSWVMRQTSPPIATVGFLIEGNPTWPALQLLRELRTVAPGAYAQLVIYRLRDGQLERGFVPWTTGGAMQIAPSTEPELGSGRVQLNLQADRMSAFTWQPLLSRVVAIQYRAWVIGQGWVPANAMLMTPDMRSPLPGAVTGVEVTVERANGERVQRVLPVKD